MTFALRIGEREFQRVCEQTAVLSGLLMGCGRAAEPPGTVPTLRAWAGRSLLSNLKFAPLNLGLLGIDDVDRAGELGIAYAEFDKACEEVTAEDGSTRSRLLGKAVADRREFDLDFLASPFDGAVAARAGRSSTVTAMLAAPPDTLALMRPQQFLLIIVGPERAAAPSVRNAIDDLAGARLGLADETDLLDAACRLPIQSLIDAIRDQGIIVPVVGHTFPPKKSFCGKLGLTRLRRRVLDGSTVAAAAAAMLGHVSMGVMVARRVQAYQIAAVTRAMNGRLLALPFHRTVVRHDPVLLTERDFIPSGADASVIMTSVTEVCFMDRVRYRPDHRVSCESLTFNVSERSVRRTASGISLTNTEFIDGGELRRGDRVLGAWADRMFKSPRGEEPSIPEVQVDASTPGQAPVPDAEAS